MKNNNNHKKRENWFDQQKKRLGENFLNLLNANQMQNDCVRIFRDLARGNIDVNVDGQYFLNPAFLACCINVAGTKFLLHNTHYRGLLALSQVDQSANTLSVLDYDKRCSDAYGLLLETFELIRTTGDVGHLVPLIAQLNKNYRFNI